MSVDEEEEDSFSEEELMRLEAIFFDANYIEHIVYPDENNRSVKCYEVVPDTIDDNEYDFVHVIRTKYYNPWTKEIKSVDSGPLVLQAEVIGTVCWTTLGAYGNWVPKGQVCPDDIKYSTDAIFSAKLSIGLRIDEATKNRLIAIEQDIKRELPKACIDTRIDRWNRIVGSRDYVTLKATIAKYNPNPGKKRKGCTASYTSESDPSGWFSRYAPNFALIDENYQPRFFQKDSANREEIPIQRSEIEKGDSVKALVSFKTYLFTTKGGQRVGGVMVTFDEVELGCHKTKLKYVSPGSEPMIPKKRGRYVTPPRDNSDHT